jgi:hypothetical protein
VKVLSDIALSLWIFSLEGTPNVVNCAAKINNLKKYCSTS